MGNFFDHIEYGRLPPHASRDGLPISTLSSATHLETKPSAVSSYSSSGGTCPNVDRKLLGQYLGLSPNDKDMDVYYSAIQRVLGELEKMQHHSPCDYINTTLESAKVHDRFSQTPQSRMDFLILVLSIIEVESKGSITAAGSSGNGLMQLILKYIGSTLYLMARDNGKKLPPEVSAFYKKLGINEPTFEELLAVRNATVAKKTGEVDKFVKRFQIRKLLTNASANIVIGSNFLGLYLSKSKKGKPISVKTVIRLYNGSPQQREYQQKVMTVYNRLKKVMKPLPEVPLVFTSPMFLRKTAA